MSLTYMYADCRISDGFRNLLILPYAKGHKNDQASVIVDAKY